MKEKYDEIFIKYEKALMWSFLRWTLLLFYFILISTVFKKFDLSIKDHGRKECNKPLGKRVVDLFIFVILPIYLLLIFSLINFYVYKYKTFRQKEITPKLLNIS